MLTMSHSEILFSIKYAACRNEISASSHIHTLFPSRENFMGNQQIMLEKYQQ